MIRPSCPICRTGQLVPYIKPHSGPKPLPEQYGLVKMARNDKGELQPTGDHALVYVFTCWQCGATQLFTEMSHNAQQFLPD